MLTPLQHPLPLVHDRVTIRYNLSQIHRYFPFVLTEVEAELRPKYKLAIKPLSKPKDVLN